MMPTLHHTHQTAAAVTQTLNHASQRLTVFLHASHTTHVLIAVVDQWKKSRLFARSIHAAVVAVRDDDDCYGLNGIIDHILLCCCF